MKRTTYNRSRKIIRYRKPSRYPNAADNRYYLDRLTDIILTAATACGAVTIVAFLITFA